MPRKNDNIVGILAYIVVGIIWYFVDKDVRDRFTRFHVGQAIALWVIGIVWWIISLVLAVIPILGWLIDVIGYIVLLVLWIWGIVNAITGKKEVPLIGGLAESIAKRI